MRELIGTRRTSEPGVVKNVYRSDLVYCSECRKTVPIGIEVITTKAENNKQTVLKHQYLCRVHGVDYESMTHRNLASSGTRPRSDNDTYLCNFINKR